ncbi:hypothetical protein ALI144C_40885 [Actinosynnema sp. ALI-1.44]|nr:hypothetical protein ALI144C_40885 [Actinosynnema sp. ALI-1.44]
MSGWDLAALAARLRRDSDDLSSYAGLLITMLADSLPLEVVRVDRKTRLFGGARSDAPVLGIAVQLGDRRFTLRRKAVGQPVTAQVRLESGGVVLRTETVGMDVWSHDLAEALVRHAQAHAATVELLQRLTLPDQP